MTKINMVKTFRQHNPFTFYLAGTAIVCAAFVIAGLVVGGKGIWRVNGALFVAFVFWNARLGGRLSFFLKERPQILPYQLLPDPTKWTIPLTHLSCLAVLLGVANAFIQPGVWTGMGGRSPWVAGLILLWFAWVVGGVVMSFLRPSLGRLHHVDGKAMHMESAGLRTGDKTVAYAAVTDVTLELRSRHLLGRADSPWHYFSLTISSAAEDWRVDLERYSLNDALFLIRTLRARAAQARWQDRLGVGDDLGHFERLAQEPAK